MICINCSYEVPYATMLEVGITKVSCPVCGTSNEEPEQDTPSDPLEKGTPYRPDYGIVPSIRDILENPKTAMVPKPRAQQVAVANMVQTALHSGESCIVEAGTGTGKTLAYLAPALSMGKRVIVATATKALQDQVMQEDGPWILEELQRYGIVRSIAVLKGKKNFACVQNFEYYKRKGAFAANNSEEEAEIRRMEEWLKAAADGEHNADLNAYPDPPPWIDMVRVEECAKKNCRKCNMCGYFRNYKEVQAADVVVTNHTMVALEYMIPAQMGNAGPDGMGDFLFGDRHAVIFDEAHQLESAFENVWKDEIDLKLIDKTLKSLSKLFIAGPALQKDVPAVFETTVPGWTTVPGEPAPSLDASTPIGCSYDGTETAGAFDEKAASVLIESITQLGKYFRYNNTDTCTIDGAPDETCTRLLGTAYAAAQWVYRGFHPYYVTLDSALKRAQTEPMSPSAYDELMQEYHTVRPLERRFVRWLDLFKSWLFPREDHVYYVRRALSEKYGDNYTLTRQPINMAKTLKGFWDKHPSVIFSSATMSTQSGGRPSFHLFQSRLGTDVADKNCIAVKSPFDFKSKCVTYFTRDRALCPPKWNVTDAARNKYYDNLAKEIGYWANLTRGNALVLFASARDLESVYERITADPRLSDYPIHAQMNERVPANVALSRYLEDARRLVREVPRRGPILLGLQSFWEGVSIKGPLLLNVMLTRMPFPVPSDPLFQKRQAKLKEHAFNILSLYPVSISARQGTGRLLRTVKDAGIVVVLDQRIASSRWGTEVMHELDVATNRFFDKPTMEKSWGFIDKYINNMLSKTRM